MARRIGQTLMTAIKLKSMRQPSLNNSVLQWRCHSTTSSSGAMTNFQLENIHPPDEIELSDLVDYDDLEAARDTAELALFSM